MLPCNAWAARNLRRVPRARRVHRVRGLQHILIECSDWHQGLRRTLVKTGIHHHDEIKFRHDKHALRPESDCSRPLNLAPVNKRAAEPEKVAVKIWAQAVDL